MGKDCHVSFGLCWTCKRLVGVEALISFLFFSPLLFLYKMGSVLAVFFHYLSSPTMYTLLLVCAHDLMLSLLISFCFTSSFHFLEAFMWLLIPSYFYYHLHYVPCFLSFQVDCRKQRTGVAEFMRICLFIMHCTQVHCFLQSPHWVGHSVLNGRIVLHRWLFHTICLPNCILFPVDEDSIVLLCCLVYRSFHVWRSSNYTRISYNCKG